MIRNLCKDHWHALSLLAVLAAGTWLRCKGLTFQSLWIDELFTYMKSRPDLGFTGVVGQFTTGEDPHPPLYFVLLHSWFRVFGFTEAAGRIIAALAGSAGLVVIYLLGRELMGKACGWIAALILAVNQFHLNFSQEARPYSMLFLFTGLSYLFLVRGARGLRTRDFIYYALASTVMVYTHYYGLVVMASQTVFMAIYSVAREERWKLLARFAGAWTLVLLLYLPWIPVVFRTIGREAFWAGKPEPTYFVNLYERFFGGEPYLVVLFSAMMLVALFQLARRASEELDFSLPLLFTWIFLCIFIPYYRSITAVPMLVTRYEIIVLPAFVIWISMGIVLCRNRLFAGLLVSSVLLVSLVSIFHHMGYYETIRKAQFREAAQQVIGEEEVYSDSERLYNIYFELLGAQVRAKPIPAEVPEGVNSLWILYGRGREDPALDRDLKRSGFERVDYQRFHEVSAGRYRRSR